MSDPIYRKELLRLAADAHGAGRLKEPHATGNAHNSACGDKVTVDLALDRGCIVAMAQDTKACVLTQASASLLARELKGAQRDDVVSLRETVRRMLAEAGSPPPAPYGGFSAFDAVIAYPGRHRCVLLPFEAVLNAFDSSDAGKPDAIGRQP